MKLKWTLPDGFVRGPTITYRAAGGYTIHNASRLIAPRTYGEIWVMSHNGEPVGESPKLIEAQRYSILDPPGG